MPVNVKRVAVAPSAVHDLMSQCVRHYHVPYGIEYTMPDGTHRMTVTNAALQALIDYGGLGEYHTLTATMRRDILVIDCDITMFTVEDRQALIDWAMGNACHVVTHSKSKAKPIKAY